MILVAIYEKDFYEVSYGFRKGHSAHQALFELREQCMNNNIGWIVDADIRGFYDSINHQKLKTVIKQRVNDGAMIKLIGKWLKAGILEDGSLSYPELGTVQGGVVSPIISNIYLHHVLDDWFMKNVKPKLKGKSFLVRFADDFVIGCELEEDARKVMSVLPKRFEKYGLTIHPEKTKLIEFKRPPKSRKKDKKNGTFDFLGFTHYWGLSLKGNWAIKRKTARKRQKRTLKRIWQWCKENRHEQLEEQHRMLCAKLRGHYNYYGLRCNIESLMRVYRHLLRTWRYWLKKRSQRNPLTLKKFDKILERYPLVLPRIVHNF
jgi:group II intron reverse transcriptase/maturase